MEVSGQFHTPAALPQRERAPGTRRGEENIWTKETGSSSTMRKEMKQRQNGR